MNILKRLFSSKCSRKESAPVIHLDFEKLFIELLAELINRGLWISDITVDTSEIVDNELPFVLQTSELTDGSPAIRILVQKKHHRLASDIFLKKLLTEARKPKHDEFILVDIHGKPLSEEEIMKFWNKYKPRNILSPTGGDPLKPRDIPVPRPSCYAGEAAACSRASGDPLKPKEFPKPPIVCYFHTAPTPAGCCNCLSREYCNNPRKEKS